jgi:hypothetical protein
MSAATAGWASDGARATRAESLADAAGAAPLPSDETPAMGAGTGTVSHESGAS